MVRLYAGVARVDITPPVGIAHANWGAASHSRAEGIDLPLWATALALRDPETGAAAVVVDLDLLHLSLPLAGSMRQAISELTGVPAAQVRVSATHTHSGPTLGQTWVEEGAELVAPYTASLPGRVAGAAWAAWRGLVPVRVAAGMGTCGIGVNRRVQAPDGRTVVGRNPSGFFDQAVRVLRLDAVPEGDPAGDSVGEGRPLVALLHYATHPTLMAHENRLITPDYPGVARRTVEAITGATCLFLQGCAGDIGPAWGITEGHTGDTSYYHRAGKILGAEAARVFLTLETRPYEATFAGVLESGAPLGVYRHVPLPEADSALRVATATATLPVRAFPAREEGEARAAEARGALATLRGEGAPAQAVAEATWRAKRIAQQAGHSRLTDGRPTVEVELQAIRVGQAALLGAPMEVFNALGAAVAEGSPFPWTAVSGYSNGSTGYLPTAEAFGPGGYEVEMASPYAPEAGERFVAAASDLLRRLR